MSACFTTTVRKYWLDAPIAQVASEDVPMPYNGRLELEAIPSVQDIVAAALDVLYRDR